MPRLRYRSKSLLHQADDSLDAYQTFSSSVTGLMQVCGWRAVRRSEQPLQEL